MKVNVRQWAAQFISLFLGIALTLFLPAGNIGWLTGWIYLVLFMGFFAGVSWWLYRHNPGLLQERMRFGTADQQGWDKILFPALSLFPLVWLLFISLDATRFHWLPVPVWIQLIGAAILLCSFYLFFLTFRENSYLSPVVRIQAERGHSVISSGPYHYVRHPMYAGMVLFMVSTPLMLGSWYGILVGMLLVALLARRAVLEERTLRNKLSGYSEYMAQVKYRFIPYVW